MGYAEEWQKAWASTGSADAANAAANKAIYGDELGPTSREQVAQGLSGTTLNVDNSWAETQKRRTSTNPTTTNVTNTTKTTNAIAKGSTSQNTDVDFDSSLSNASGGGMFEGVWGDFFSWAEDRLGEAPEGARSYEDISSMVADQLAPLHQSNLDNLNRQLGAQQGKLASQMSERGMYYSTPNDQKSAELIAGYGNAVADEDARFLGQVADTASGMYNQELAVFASNKASYNQSLVNLGMGIINGMIDQERLISDDAYRKAELARAAAKDQMDYFGTVKAEGGVTSNTNINTSVNTPSPAAVDPDANQRSYLQNLAANGSYGEKEWAKRNLTSGNLYQA